MFAGLAAAAVGVVLAVSNGLGAATTGGVAAAQAVRIQVTRTVHLDGTVVRVTQKTNGAVCFTAPHAGDCAASLGASQLAYATGRSGRHVVLTGVVGSSVKAVIVRLSKKGTVWPKLRNGAFYAVLPADHRLTGIVKVLAGGRRITFTA